MSDILATGNDPVAPNKSSGYMVPLYTLISLFFMWGFITCMNDILIPHLKELFKLSYLESMLVQFCFFGAYFTGSLIYFLISYYSGDPINKIGYKKGIMLGLLIAALGCCLFYPAATFSEYWIFLTALFILGLGFTLLQITANVYVALLGTVEGASSRLNLAQAFNSFGTTIAPIVGGFLIFEKFSEQEHLSAQASRMPYIVFAVIFLLVGLLIYKVKLPVFKSEAVARKGLGALAFPHLKLGILGIFCYVGAEVAIGSFMINFLELEEIMDLTEAESKNYLAIYWGGAMIGRFLGAISLSNKLAPVKKLAWMAFTAGAVFLLILSIVDLSFNQVQYFLVFILLNLLGFVIGKSHPARTLVLFACINILLVTVGILSSGETAMWTILSVGLFNSIMWSNIFTLSIAGLGKHTNQGSSLLIMAILGGALIPLLQGGLADLLGVQYSFVLPVLCYCYVAFFGWYCLRNIKEVSAAGTIGGGH
jgi:FHS family L-fucose permease-like MFS transporter